MHTMILNLFLDAGASLYFQNHNNDIIICTITKTYDINKYNNDE